VTAGPTSASVHTTAGRSTRSGRPRLTRGTATTARPARARSTARPTTAPSLLDPEGNSVEAVHVDREEAVPDGRIDHLWIRVHDPKASQRFYTTIAPHAGRGRSPGHHPTHSLYLTQVSDATKGRLRRDEHKSDDTSLCAAEVHPIGGASGGRKRCARPPLSSGPAAGPATKSRSGLSSRMHTPPRGPVLLIRATRLSSAPSPRPTKPRNVQPGGDPFRLVRAHESSCRLHVIVRSEQADTRSGLSLPRDLASTRTIADCCSWREPQSELRGRECRIVATPGVCGWLMLERPARGKQKPLWPVWPPVRQRRAADGLARA
jgi:hypothetical protein